MHYLNVSSWIFVALVLLVALVIVFPTSTMIWLCLFGLHVLIAAQVVVVLRAEDGSEHTFSDKWYEE